MKQNNPIRWLCSTKERIVSCLSMSCCSSFHINSTVWGQFALPGKPRLAQQLQFYTLPLFWGLANLALYLELNLLAVLTIVQYHQYHAFTSTANDDETGGLASLSQLCCCCSKALAGSLQGEKATLFICSETFMVFPNQYTQRKSMCIMVLPASHLVSQKHY